MNAFFRNVTYTALLLFLSYFSSAQTTDSTRTPLHVAGGVTVTNNGISLIPTFTLGKPAVMFDLAVGGKRHSFEPQFRFSLEGKPWTLLFWWRYKLVEGKRFRVGIGAHPAMAFFKVAPSAAEPGIEMMVAKRALAAEVSPHYQLSKNVNVGVYYITARGFDPGLSKTVHFLSLRSTISSINLTNGVSLQASPQVYYLRMDDKGGFYVTSTFGLAKKGFPISLQSIVNQRIKTQIVSKPTVWNVSLVYWFDKKFKSA